MTYSFIRSVAAIKQQWRRQISDYE